MTAFPSELNPDYPLPICNTVQFYTLSPKSQEPLPERISDLLQHSLRITGCDARHPPEKPSIGRSSHLAHSNQAIRWRLLQPPLPSGDHHRRAIQPLSESQLIQPKFLSQRSNPPRPCGQGSSHELAGPGHICLQDNKLSSNLHAHTFAPSIHGNRGADLSIFVDSSITKAAHQRQPKDLARLPWRPLSSTPPDRSLENPLIAIYDLW